MKTAFNVLNKIDVSKYIEKKNGLSYLSWAKAWENLLANFPKSVYKVYENKDEWNYHTDGRTAWVKVGVTTEDIEHIEMLPVMDFRNKSIPLGNITSFDVNKAIQRALTKAIARHGLGLYIYMGEDLPVATETTKAPPPSKATASDKKQAWSDFTSICENMGVDATEFLSSLMDMSDKNAVYSDVRKWLNNESLLRDTLLGYKNG